jgi:hypothetical protein
VVAVEEALAAPVVAGQGRAASARSLE